jgi:hypothetical protein
MHQDANQTPAAVNNKLQKIPCSSDLRADHWHGRNVALLLSQLTPLEARKSVKTTGRLPSRLQNAPLVEQVGGLSCCFFAMRAAG